MHNEREWVKAGRWVRGWCTSVRQADRYDLTGHIANFPTCTRIKFVICYGNSNAYLLRDYDRSMDEYLLAVPLGPKVAYLGFFKSYKNAARVFKFFCDSISYEFRYEKTVSDRRKDA